MIPEGRYKCRAVEGKLAKTNDGNGQMAVDIVITEEESEHCGQHRTWYGSFTEKSIDRTLQSLRLLGWQGDDLSDLVGLGDTEAYVTITHEEYEGEIRDRAAWINASAGLAVKTPMDEGEAKAFAERMKGHVLGFNQRTQGGSPNTGKSAASSGGAAGGGKPKSQATKKKQQQGDFAPDQGDDIPF